MPIKVGEVEALFRYPVKSMRGEPLEVADLGWHGLDGDRRLAFRRADDRGGFPWLTAGKLPELILFSPERRGTRRRGRPPDARSHAGRRGPARVRRGAGDGGRSPPWLAGPDDAPEPRHLRRSERLRDHLHHGWRDRAALGPAPGRSTIPAEHPDRIAAIRPLRGGRLGGRRALVRRRQRGARRLASPCATSAARW